MSGIPLVQLTAPLHIWLQVGDDLAHLSEPFTQNTEEYATWSADAATLVSVPYVRADECEMLRSEIERLRAKLSDAETNAKRYQWLRSQHWSDGKFAVVQNPKTSVKLTSFCPSHELLDNAIDAELLENGASHKPGNA